jgi:hypothetical protein
MRKAPQFVEEVPQFMRKVLQLVRKSLRFVEASPWAVLKLPLLPERRLQRARSPFEHSRMARSPCGAALQVEEGSPECATEGPG